MPRYAYDTEFIEDGHTIDLVSIGVCDIDAPERFYHAVSAEFDVKRLLAHPWLAENVAPHLPWSTPGVLDAASPLVKSRRQIRDDLAGFLRAGGEVELWADYGAYDHVALCQLWGSMVDLPAGLPMFTRDVQQYARAAGVDPAGLPNQSSTAPAAWRLRAHDALADAWGVAACVRHIDAAQTKEGQR